MSKDSNSSDSEKIIPPGTPYITRRDDGRLMWARSKQPRRADIVAGVLREVLARRKSVRKRSQSLDKGKDKTPLLINGERFTPALKSQFTEPLPQQGFTATVPQQAFAATVPTTPVCPCTPLLPQHAQHPPPIYPTLTRAYYTVPDPYQGTIPTFSQAPATIFATPEESDQLRKVDAHFRKMTMEPPNAQEKGAGRAAKEPSKPTVLFEKHVCAQCGKVRSKKYHKDHHVKPGENATPDYCRKCQADDSSESESEIVKELRKAKKKVDEKLRGKVNNRQVVLSQLID